MKCNYCRKETTFQFNLVNRTIVCKKCGKRSPPSCNVNRCKHKFSPETFSCVICGLEMMKPSLPSIPSQQPLPAGQSVQPLTPGDVLTTPSSQTPSLQGTILPDLKDNHSMTNEEFMEQLMKNQL